MAALFGGNPFSSQVGQRIEQVTDSSRPSEDWTLILEICDIINENDEGPKDSIKAIRKRLSNKNAKCIIYTLTVVEACVKNCGPRFHKQIASKDFLNDLTKLLGQKGQPSSMPQVVQEKILSLIQSWSDAFRNAPELQNIKQTYDSLKQQGVEFPAQDLDKLAPIFTPSRLSDGSANQQAPPPRTYAPAPSSRPQTAPASSAHHPQQQRMPPVGSPVHSPANNGPINPSPEQMAKLRSELDIVEGNVRVLNEMLSELQPGKENSGDYELLVELNKTCREMQKRLVSLLDRIANEEVTGVLLRINDDLNNVFIRYDRYDRNRKAVTGQVQPKPQDQVSTSPPQRSHAADTRTTGGSSLIDFSDLSSAQNQPNEQDDEFDMFAQSRGTTFADSRVSGSTYDDNREGVPSESFAGVMSAKGPYPKLPTPPPEPHDEADDDLEDVEKWLQGTNLEELEKQDRAAREEALRQDQPPHPGVQTSETLSSTEFDKFLSERATTGAQNAQLQPKEPQPARQMTNVISGEHEKTEDAMFGL
eukprot:TCONS_00046788-protein